MNENKFAWSDPMRLYFGFYRLTEKKKLKYRKRNKDCVVRFAILQARVIEFSNPQQNLIRLTNFGQIFKVKRPFRILLVCLPLQLQHPKQCRYNNDLIVSTGYDDVIKWKRFPRCWLIVRRIHRSPVNSSHKGQWRRALMFSLICARTNGWVNNRDARD